MFQNFWCWKSVTFENYVDIACQVGFVSGFCIISNLDTIDNAL